MKFIDIHVHCTLATAPHEGLLGVLEDLRAQGLEKMVVFGMPTVDVPIEVVRRVMPRWVKSQVSESNFRQPEAMTLRKILGDDVYDDLIVHFLDTRFYVSDLWGALEATPPADLRGLKVIYIPSGNALGVESVYEALGVTLEQYQDIHQRTFQYAQKRGLPMIYHLDLNQDLVWARRMLEEYRDVRLNIPHFGFSRRLMDPLFEEFDNLYSDTSALLPHMQKDPASYRDFIARHPDRIMMGSDCLMHDLSSVPMYARCISQMGLSPDVRDAVLRGNACRFLA